MVGFDGPPLARVRRGATGVKQTAEQRKANDQIIQAALKKAYERQQAQAS